MKFPGTHKDVEHFLITVINVGEGGVVGCIEERIFNTKFMRKEEVEEIGATCVLSLGSVWTEYCFEFITVAMPNLGVNVSSDDEVGSFWDFVQ